MILTAALLAAFAAAAVFTWYRVAHALPPASPQIQSETLDLLSVFMAGNRDLARLQELAAAHRDAVTDAILRCQALIGGRSKELCDLAAGLGLVERWCHEARSSRVAKRRAAFSRLAAVAHSPRVLHLAGGLPAKGFCDADEQIRIDSGRILLATRNPGQIAHVWERALSDTPRVRAELGAELGRYAVELCSAAIPEALEKSPHDTLTLLISWERALPLPDLESLAGHSDAAVREELMRLMPFLPPTSENLAAIDTGLGDCDSRVRSAAEAARNRIALPEHQLEMEHAS